MPCVTWHIALRSQFHCYFSPHQSPRSKNPLALWPTVTIHRNGFIGYALASGLQCDGWRCKNLSSRTFYLRAKCNSIFPNDTHHSNSPDLWGYGQSITRSFGLLGDCLKLSLELCACWRWCFPHWNFAKQWLAVLFSLVQIARRDPSYPRFQVLWRAPGLTSTQRKLHRGLGAWVWIVVAVVTKDAHSACHNTSRGIALPTPSHSVGPLRASSDILCIDTS